MKIGIIKEAKVPQDRRVPFTPKHCRLMKERFPQLEIKVESSDIRCYSDGEYLIEGIEVADRVDDCDILFGVKEVPVDDLIPDKTYLYFSHTHKLQPYNQELIRANIKKNIRLIDYECLVKPNGVRVLGFGRFAGLVGAYNGLIAYGKKFNGFSLKPAHRCKDLIELIKELKKVNLGSEKIILTGTGRVANGAKEILDAIGIQRVDVYGFLNKTYDHAVYAMAGVEDYIIHPEKSQWTEGEFFEEPNNYESDFMKFCNVADIFIAGHFWDNRSPVFFTEEDYINGEIGFKVIADISCDIAVPIPTTLRSSTIADPFYDISSDSLEEKEAFSGENNLTVMAVDNLPCELPRDASESFGDILLQEIIPCFCAGDDEGILKNATLCEKGMLADKYIYMKEFVEGQRT